MIKETAWKELPHSEIVVKNGSVSIPSIFMFKGGPEELFPFLMVCQDQNCTVYFENEDITVNPEPDSFQNVTLSLYAVIAATPTIPTQYMRYVMNLDKMVWPEHSNEEA